MKLITEHYDQLNYIVEDSAVGGNRNVIIEGIFMQADIENKNCRIYPKSILEKAVDDYVNTFVSKNRAVGELSHPEGPSINLHKVSHRITELKWNGNDVVGKALILNTPMGLVVKGLIEGGCQLGVSSRGMGTVGNKGGKTYVNTDYVLATVDIVQDPSTHAAFVNGIMESCSWVWENGILLPQQIEKYEKEIKRTSSAQLAEVQEKLFSDFLSKL